jgi:hypothetical protein
LEPRKVILSKPKYADFIRGQKFLVSENFKSLYEQSGLKGVKAFIPVEVSKIRYMRENSPLPPRYYVLDLVYSYARVDMDKSIIKGQPLEEWQNCSLCEPFGVTKSEIKGIHIDDTNWGGEDIFHLHEMGGFIYASDQFIEFCLDKALTNLRYINTKDYVFEIYPGVEGY